MNGELGRFDYGKKNLKKWVECITSEFRNFHSVTEQ